MIVIRRIYSNSTEIQFCKSIEIILLIIKSINDIIDNYYKLYSEEELKILSKAKEFLDITLSKINCVNNEKKIILINKCFDYEEILKPLVFRCWDYELSNGAMLVSWIKTSKIGSTPSIISTTLTKDFKNTFCNSRIGIKYEVLNGGGIIAACYKDGATLISDSDTKTIYSVGQTKDGKTINSYNLSLGVMTPNLILNEQKSNYKSKYNEVILDSRYVVPKSVVYLNENDIDFVNEICSKLNINAEKIDLDKTK